MDPYRFQAGTAPLLVSVPHAGTHLPAGLADRMTAAGRGLADTDWHVDRLYDFLGDLGASVVVATHSRYAIDLNRDPAGKPLYPGASETGLCPVSSFDDAPLYQAGQEPDAVEIEARREAIWQPYHDCLAAELAAIKERHGLAVLWDAHSIRSAVPRFFDGRLPDLNIGTANGKSAESGLVAAVTAAAEAAEDFSHVLNGRFKGGFITRAYGRPEHGIHALQLELSQITYMDERPPYTFHHDLAGRVRPVLRRMLEACLSWAGERN